MAQIQYNVGTFKGYLGTAVVYLAKTAGGTEFLAHKASVVVTVGQPAVDKWIYTSRSSMQSYMASMDGTLSSNIDLSKMADVAPSGVLDGDGYVIIDNGASVPRLYNSEPFYSLKGDGVVAYTGDTGTPVSGNKDATSTVVINSTAKTISDQISEAASWAMKNPLIIIAIALAISELAGWTNFLGLRKKKVGAKRR